MIRPTLAQALPSGEKTGQVGDRFGYHLDAVGGALKPQQDLDVVGVTVIGGGVAFDQFAYDELFFILKQSFGHDGQQFFDLRQTQRAVESKNLSRELLGGSSIGHLGQGIGAGQGAAKVARE